MLASGRIKVRGALLSMKKIKFGLAEYLDTLHPLFKIYPLNKWR